MTSASLRHDGLGIAQCNRQDMDKDDVDGFGNLADELSEAWENESGYNPHLESSIGQNGEIGSILGPDAHYRSPEFEVHHDIDVSKSGVSYDGGNDLRSLSPPKQTTRTRSRRKTSTTSDYDGSDYGDSADLESVAGISASLEHRLAAIESLARRGLESNGSGADGLIDRVTENLRELSSQAGLESGATRLLTAHTAVASNLTHQIRLIKTLSHHFVSPFSVPLTLDEIEILLPLLASTIELLPPPEPRVISLFHSLHSSAADLIGTLSTLADSLHMLRQTTSLASRKLRAAKDTVDEFRRESQMRDDGIRWLEEGNWDTRLSNRECGTICGDVVDGFKNTCERWEDTIRENALSYHALGVTTE